jgi:hypothetical protein
MGGWVFSFICWMLHTLKAHIWLNWFWRCIGLRREKESAVSLLLIKACCHYKQIFQPLSCCDTFNQNIKISLHINANHIKGIHLLFFYCCTMHFDNVKILFTNKCTFFLTYKMLKFTIKISLYLLLHVSVHPDQPQGPCAEPCQSYTSAELISKNTSL